ncbi:vesicle-trafficking protein SEC22b-like [Haliotis cracherodii]|uniref:vesicle-trafficking protein SEC22b-like n=1 Tax=Haliotis cracherodii TaxID=6455 RepID=UPI0039EAEAC8
MVLLTMIARVADGLPLAASVQEDEQAGRGMMEYQNQAKQLFRKISTDPQPPTRCSLETGPFIFHYFLERGVCYLVLCEKSFSKRLAYTYLEDLQGEFASQYGSRVETVSRPYSFIEFDTFIQRTRKSYMDSRARRNLTNINTELQDVQRIMVQNIDDVLQRGEALSVLGDKASNLSTLSQKYKKDAKYLNLRSSYFKIGVAVIVVVVFLLLFRYWFL